MSPAPLSPHRASLPAWLRILVYALAGGAAASLALEFGFHRPPLPKGILIAVQLAAVAAYLLSRGWQLASARKRLAELQTIWLDALLLLGACVFLLFESSQQSVLSVSSLYVATIQGLLILRLVIESFRLNLALSQSKLHPARVMAVTFAVLIVLGTLALSLPRSTQPSLRDRPDFSTPRHVLNCAFTAVSATCVTGLVVYDTGADFTLAGQVIILVLIQLGGLGIMIFGTTFGLLAGRHFSLRHSLALQDALGYRTLGQMRHMTVFIILLTFGVEAVGAVMLLPLWADVDGFGNRVFYSVFHSVSAFCNAGFGLRSDSLVSYNRSWQVYGCIAPLIVLGGLGFPVVDDLWRWVIRWIQRLWAAARHGKRPRPHRFSLHTRIVLITSLFLIIVPALGFVLFESFSQVREPAAVAGGAVPDASEAMRHASWAGRVVDAVFLSITCRTAGFNTVPTDADSLSPATHLLAAMLMFIGGSPASTAGGIKTTCFAVLVLAVWATIRGRQNVEACGRTIPEITLRRAATIATIMFLAEGTAILMLNFTEPVTLREVMFEAVSACGTVGLSTGLTPDLTIAGRVVIMAAMFVGRLGPLTLLIALAGGAKPARYEYPAEAVVIG